MSFFNKIRLDLHQRFLNKIIKEHKTERHSTDFRQVASIGILFDATEQNSRDLVYDYAQTLQKRGKKVELLAFFDSPHPADNFAFKAFNRKALDLAMRPKDPEAKSFTDRPFDLLLNLYLGDNIPLEYLSTISKAHLRVGHYSEKTHCFDLMIDTPAKNNLAYFIQQVEFFLKTMNAKDGATI